MPIINQIVKGGGTTPTGTKSITANGVYDVTNYASADVQVPTTAPAYYIEKTKDANNVLQNGTTLMNFSGLTGIGNYVLDHAYYGNNNITGTVDLSSITSVGTNGLYQCLYQCRNITSVDLSSLTTIGSYGCNSICRECTSLTSFDLSNLKDVGQYGIREAFYGCTGLTSVSLPALNTITQSSACQNMFQGCTGITSANLGSLYVISGFTAGSSMFYGCTSLTNVNINNLISMTGSCSSMFQNCRSITSFEFPKLAKVNGSSTMASMFSGCTGLTSLSFPKLAYTTTNFNGSLGSMLSGVTGCTVHFPAEWETTMSSWSNVTNGFGGTNTTVLFDLPNVTTLDLSPITVINVSQIFQNFASGNYFPNITSVDLSNLTTVTGQNSCSGMFQGCTGITSVDLSSLETVEGDNACQRMFQGCTGITSIDLSSLVSASGSGCCSEICGGCTGITSVNISSLKTANGFYQSFYNCTGITSVDLSSLEVIGYCSGMFNGCTSITGSLDLSKVVSICANYGAQYMFSKAGISSVDLSSLKTINSQRAAFYMFSNCTGLTSIYLPAIKTINGSEAVSNFINGVSNCTIHLPSNFSGNPNFGGTNTTVLKDLPATNILTGADTVEYERNPKYDTVTALAWRVKDGGTYNEPIIDWTPYYTSGLTDPTVGTTIYSDSACTIAETTVSSIA